MSETITRYPSVDHLRTGNSKLYNSDFPGRENNYKWFIQEKIDGSQLTMQNIGGDLKFFCRGKAVNGYNAAFGKSIEMLSFVHEYGNETFSDKHIYHGESVCTCRHNAVNYNRTPRHYFICYDIFNVAEKRYLNLQEMETECKRIHIEMVPTLYVNDDPNVDPYKVAGELVEKIEDGKLDSILGGTPEGVVIKHHELFNSKGKIVSTKHKLVSEKFKENRLQKMGEKKLKSPEDFIVELGRDFATEARFQKAYQHLSEESKLTGESGKDYPLLLAELNADFDKEYKNLIMRYLWSEFSPIIKKEARGGFTEWVEKKYEEKHE